MSENTIDETPTDETPQETPEVPEETTEEPAPVADEGLVGKVVTWDETDDYGYTRQKFGVVLGAHEIHEDKLDVAPLTGSLERAYDPADLTAL